MDFKLMPLNEKDLPIFVPAMKDSFNQAAQVQDSSLEDVKIFMHLLLVIMPMDLKRL